jgi:predicted transcriptional regulator
MIRFVPTPKFTLHGFRRPREAVQISLGKLEREIMEEVWKRGESSVREVHIAFGERAAYTTLMTTLDRLHRKGLLNRRKEGRAFLYSPRVTREEFERVVAKDIIEGLLKGNPKAAEPLLGCIVEAVSERDRDLLDELDRLVKAKRKELKGDG